MPLQPFRHLVQRVLRNELPAFAVSVVRGEYGGGVGIGVGVGDAAAVLVYFGDAGGAVLVGCVGVLGGGGGVGVVEWFDSVAAVGSDDCAGEGEGGVGGGGGGGGVWLELVAGLVFGWDWWLLLLGGGGWFGHHGSHGGGIVELLGVVDDGWCGRDSSSITFRSDWRNSNRCRCLRGGGTVRVGRGVGGTRTEFIPFYLVRGCIG